MKLLLTLSLAALLAGPALAQSPSPLPSPSVGPPEIGPARGTLVIVGGGLKSESILKRFLDLAGGPEASLVIIPTAGESDDLSDYAGDVRELTDAGARHVKVVPTRDRKVADTEAFVAPLREARGVWFPGGRHWRLAVPSLRTRTQAALRDVLARGGVIGGTSAGAIILGSFMVRGDTRGNAMMVGDHVEGMGFLKNVTIY